METKRDWSKWLPPHDLPDTGTKNMRDGQVWAYRCGGLAGVALIVNGKGKSLASDTVGTVATPGSAVLSREGEHQLRAILVADVGCEPTPPEILYGPQPPKASQDVRPAMEATSSGMPLRCIRCGNDKTFGDGYYMHDSCWERDEEQSFDWSEEWDKGARDFPRPQEPTAAIPGPGVVENPKTGPWYVVGVDWAAGVPVKREVSHDGRTWVDYERLTDADPFSAYRHRRENGVVIKTPETRPPVSPRYDFTDRCAWQLQVTPGAASERCGGLARNRSPYCEKHVAEAMAAFAPPARPSSLGGNE